MKLIHVNQDLKFAGNSMMKPIEQTLPVIFKMSLTNLALRPKFPQLLVNSGVE